MTRYIAIPKRRSESALARPAPGFAPATRLERIQTLRNEGLQNTDRMSDGLRDRFERQSERGYKILASPARQTPITGVAVIEGDAAAAEDLQNDLPDHDVIEDFDLHLIAPKPAGPSTAGENEVDFWHHEKVMLAAARGQGFAGSGEGVGVAVLDTGVNEVAELQGRIANAYVLDPYLNILSGPPQDTDGHGTGVAALVAGKAVGIAPGATLTSFTTIPRRQGSYSNFLVATEFIAAQPGIAIANISAGVPDWEPRIKPGIQALLDAYVFPIVAVGNEGAGTSRSPGNFSEVLSVGACRKDGTIWSGSGSAARNFEGMEYTVPNLVAPGHRVTTCDATGAFRLYNGSSLAAPIVAGLAALIIERYGNITDTELREAILDSCAALSGVDVLRQGRGMAQVPLFLYNLNS